MSGASECVVAQATPVQSLADVLEEELRILLRIRELAQKQRSILSTGRPDALWDNLAELELCWQELHAAEDRRQLVARRLSDLGALGDEGAALREVVAALPPGTAAPLPQLHAALSAAAADVAELNLHNARLIRGLLQLTGQRLQFFTALQQGFQPYDAFGRKAGASSAVLQGGRLA